MRGPHAALILTLAAEVAAFGLLGTNFLTAQNAAEVARLSVEVGLLAVALTPVIVTGGIDLSVGSLMSLVAVLFGMMWRDARLPVGVAAPAAVGIGALAGGLNGVLVARLGLPPLIVTLGTLSLFRGLAEGLTGGVVTYTGFPPGFLALGQGYVFGVPVQLVLFAAVAVGFWVFLHRTVYGRALEAIGFSSDGARYAGIPIRARVFTVYLLSGTAAGLAAVVYVAHIGQAKADAGTGYELLAITAVVLGGTSIFGGRGTVTGTLLGLAVIAVLQNGLRLADLPTEMAGILTGVLLLTTIGLDRLRTRVPAVPPAPSSEGGFEMKNSQLAVLCAAILIAAGLIAGSNWYLARSFLHGTGAGPRNGKKLVVAMMPKSKGNAYFASCKKGADEGAKELGVELIWDGPTETDPAKQAEVIEAWITRGVDVIAVAVENREGLSTVLRKARSKGIKVVTWDADADPDARDFFVNQATPQGIGYKLTDEAATALGGKGKFAVVTASTTAANQNEWLKYVRERRESKYPEMVLTGVYPCDDKRQKAFEVANTVMNADRDVKLLMAICTPAVPGAAEAVEQAKRADVKVVGLGLPKENARFVKAGITTAVILWNTTDLGYLAVYAAARVADGGLKPGATSVEAGRLGRLAIRGDNVLLGEPFAFTKDNIDRFDF